MRPSDTMLSLVRPAYGWPGRAAATLAPSVPFADRYLLVLGVALLGYGLMGRGFAYVGLPPLFVGEMLLAAGLVALVGTGGLGRVLTLGPMPVLLALMGWVLVRTLPFLGAYGLDAVRDAMIVGYGLFAFVVAGLIAARPERLRTLFVRYRVFAVVMLAVAWAAYLVVRQAPGLVPTWPWAGDTRIVENKPGDLLVHLAGITAFLVLGFRRATPLLLALLVLGVGIMMIGNRGGMLGYLLAMGLFALMKPREARFGRLAYVAVLLVALALVADTSHLSTNEGSRTLAVEQIWENVRSVFGQSEASALNTTTEWRLEWWERIADETFNGPYFWQGRGFGVNLATVHGFDVDALGSLRSPHNGHITFLARGGVPAFALWLLVQGLWFGTLVGAWRRAKRAGKARWMGVFAFCAVYGLAALVNATFDVYLEGPVGAIWFWTVWGAGMGAVWVFRRHPDFWDLPAEGSVSTEEVSNPVRTWGWGPASSHAPASPRARNPVAAEAV